MKGSYSILVETPQSAEIGALGVKKFQKKYAVYNGSAFGPGGLKRVLRHFSNDKNLHWHIDYLLEDSTVLKAWIFPGRDLECSLSSRMSYPVQGFGSSDCSCDSHLFEFDSASPGVLEGVPDVKVMDRERYRDYQEKGSKQSFEDFICNLPGPQPDQER